jgi:hypothetical protein
VAGVLVATAPNLPLNDTFTAILIGGVLMCLLGAVDDAVQLSPAVKLVGRSGARCSRSARASRSTGSRHRWSAPSTSAPQRHP